MQIYYRNTYNGFVSYSVRTHKWRKRTGCFSSSISSFTASIQDANQQINELDVNDANASQELLSILDGLDEKFKELADLSVPEQYQSIETLADEASENMTNAVSYFHSAYEGEAFDEQDADVAYQYYTRAMGELNI